MSATTGRPGRLAAVAAATALGLVLLSPAARAEGWRSAQPLPPPASEGETSVGVPVPLGHIGQISFWAPNRGLLITAGNEAIPAGLYYYDGVSWRELSTVCGGAEGRIAWAGPEEFWTISDQQAGQQLGGGVNGTLEGADRSLCRFAPGPSGKLEVVASYAEPIGLPNSYQPMDAAACSGPSDCWFGGEILPAGANSGAFHLHWNGAALTPLPSLEVPEPQLEDPARKVAGLVFYRGRLYESVQVQASDQAPSESLTQPYVLHRIVEGSSKPFQPLITEQPLVYGEPGVHPWELSAFRFSGDEDALWAIAGPEGSDAARVTALRLGAGGFHQIGLSDPSGALVPGEEIGGVAAEPGGEDAWVSLDPSSGTEGGSQALARVARIQADGTVEPQAQLPEAGEGIGHKGTAGAIACPAQNDCWVATGQGWLFHRGGDYPEDGDLAFQALISYRPPDASIPFVAPEDYPEDNSGDNPGSIPPPPGAAPAKPPQTTVHAPLFSEVVTKLLRGSTLALSFTLATKSRVKLVALRRKRQVAATRPTILAGGRHTLKLHLRRGAWPTKLDLQVEAIGPVPLIAAGAGGGPEAGHTNGPSTLVTTSMRAPGPRMPDVTAAPLSAGGGGNGHEPLTPLLP